MIPPLFVMIPTYPQPIPIYRFCRYSLYRLIFYIGRYRYANPANHSIPVLFSVQQCYICVVPSSSLIRHTLLSPLVGAETSPAWEAIAFNFKTSHFLPSCPSHLLHPPWASHTSWTAHVRQRAFIGHFSICLKIIILYTLLYCKFTWHTSVLNGCEKDF